MSKIFFRFILFFFIFSYFNYSFFLEIPKELPHFNLILNDSVSYTITDKISKSKYFLLKSIINPETYTLKINSDKENIEKNILFSNKNPNKLLNVIKEIIFKNDLFKKSINKNFYEKYIQEIKENLYICDYGKYIDNYKTEITFCYKLDPNDKKSKDNLILKVIFSLNTNSATKQSTKKISYIFNNEKEAESFDNLNEINKKFYKKTIFIRKRNIEKIYKKELIFLLSQIYKNINFKILYKNQKNKILKNKKF